LSFLEDNTGVFFRNLLLGDNNLLQNRSLHVSVQSIKEDISKSQNNTLERTMDETLALKYIKANSRTTQKEMAKPIRKIYCNRKTPYCYTSKKVSSSAETASVTAGGKWLNDTFGAKRRRESFFVLLPSRASSGAVPKRLSEFL
jgi:hypothetical protein